MPDLGRRCSCGLTMQPDDGWYVCEHCDIPCKTPPDACAHCRLASVKRT